MSKSKWLKCSRKQATTQFTIINYHIFLFFWLRKAISYLWIPMIKIILPITVFHSAMHSQLCNAINYAWMVCLPHSKLQGKLFPLKGLVSLKCTNWQEAKGSWCLRNQDWAVPVCISISANRSKCYWSFCAVKLLLSCPLHLTIGILDLAWGKEVDVPSSQNSAFLKNQGYYFSVLLMG